MLVKIVLDNPHGHFTNLDVITGRVILQVPSPGTISHVTVKLEGESRTRLVLPPPPGQPGRDQRPRPVLEVHKLLYKVQKVFPPANSPPTQDPNPAFLLQFGTYTYPFQFKIPFNNSCNAQNSASKDLSFAGLSLEVARMPTHHVKATLPPNLYYVGEADIRYYVKVTVGRPSILKQNPRAFANFNFVPIEPPRAVTDGEVYARRQHQFLHDNGPPPLPDRKGSGFGDMMKRKPSVSSSPVTSGQPLPPARFSVDARIPNPAILTCGQDIPLKVFIKQLSEKSEPLYLQTLQIELVGHTRVRAHEAVRTEGNSWIITSLSNLNQPIGAMGDAVGTETELTKEFWYGHPLPNTVAPSFVTCNIARSYELVVSVGLAYGAAKSGMNQFVVLPLRLNLEVFSGITPPPDLLKRMEATPHPLGPEASYAPSANQQSPPSYAEPSQSGSQLPPQSAPGHEDAPPSYEDAISSDLPPLIGPRPAYHPPPAPEGESRIGGNEKTGLH